MKIINTLFLLLALTACREQPEKPQSSHENIQDIVEVSRTNYPEELVKILNAHGGLDQWRSMKSLVYEIPKSNYSEVHTIDLYSRKDRVDTPDYSMGFDGKKVWLEDAKKLYEGDPVFYHNLMFYFYAMPFVLADDGIFYSDTQELSFEGKTYPGIRISYQADIGTSPKDEYFIHYDPETNQMAWLGYTVTYRTGEKSDNVKWIRYREWQQTSGLILPKAITWYNYEGKTIKDPKSTLLFEKVSLEREAHDPKFFEKPPGGKIVNAKKQS